LAVYYKSITVVNTTKSSMLCQYRYICTNTPEVGTVLSYCVDFYPIQRSPWSMYWSRPFTFAEF